MSGTDFLRSIQAELERSKASVPGATAPRGTWPIGTPDSSARQQHTSLLVTPASRHAGGRLTPQPNPSILGGYERRLEAEAGYSFRSSPLTATSGRPAAAAGAAPAAVLSSHAGVVTTRFTPRDPSPFRGAGGSSFHGTAAAGGSRRPASAAAGAGIGSPLKKPSLLEQHMLAQQAPAAQAKAIAASAAAAGSPFYRPSPAAAKLAGSGALADGTSPRRATLQEQLRQLQLDCSRTAAQNSTAVASSAAATLLARPSSQLQMQQDFRIRAYPGSSAAPAVAQAARPAAPGTEAASSGGGSPARAAVAAVEELQQQEQAADWRPSSAASSPAGKRLAAEQAAGDSPRGTIVLLSRINELEAQLQLERMKSQEAAAAAEGLQEQCDQLQQRAAQQAGAVEAAHLRAAEAEARATEAMQEAAALRGDVQRRQSVHSDSIDSIARMQAVGQVQRQENEELRQRVAQLSEAWDQENAHVTRLQHQLQDMLATAGSSESQVAERLRRAEEEWEQRLQEVRQQAQEEQRELASRCQMLAIEKVAQEQAARQAAARQQAAEERCAVAEQRWRQLAADMDAVAADSEGQDQQLLAARQQAEAAGDAVRQLRRQLQEQQQHCEGLEAALAGEQERSSSIAARAETAEAAQHGLGSHVKATHTQMKRLQDQLAGAQRQCRQLQDENEELRQAHTTSQASYEHQLTSMQGRLAEMEQERDQLRQHLAKATADFEAQLQASGQHRQQVAALQQAALSAQVQREALESRLAQLECQLQEARQAAAAAEDRLAKAGRNGSGASPLRDVVTGLRMELQEKDLQLMQACRTLRRMHEDLSRERGKAQELQKQAVELDDLQRDSSDAFSLRQQLAAAQHAEAQARREVQQLRKQAAAPASHANSQEDGGDMSPRSSSSSGMSGGASPARHGASRAAPGRLDAATRELQAARQEIERLKGERDRVRGELEERDTEVMQLQGQLVMLQQQVKDEDNWLSPLPDPYDR
ncbi:hypothetical protein CHLNCDRAFT_144270 [Chlorella variabilis]|uniref:Uncharacterized protein n=1 Tax=Chlorella variabilis TaxID=554065 RepID=E1ZCB2_CHLVA|nr:hypothetical protein CHLNCDRAFT_144270 [Chlorella variabilis]EFN56577.1 hypothetical protein CHLNCDRAFT_144270 [Chlorella variabilis]|eukprot:XP_005848679.1 hypothetical protein CHLNCDRAFT_144270 [Chlorella variabilis]